MNLTSTIQDTIVPCSAYLAAQSASAEIYPGYPRVVYPDFRKAFGRSPECHAFALGEGSPLYGRCDNSTGALGTPELYQPPGVRNSDVYEYACCGPCRIGVDEVRVLFFPEPGSENLTCTAFPPGINNTSPVSSSLAPAKRQVTESPSAIATGPVIATIDGYTFTSLQSISKLSVPLRFPITAAV